MFAGTMGVMQGLDSVLKAAEHLLEKQPTIQFVLVGGGVERDRLRRAAAERHLTNVTFLERQPPEAMGAILALADVLLVHLKDTPLFRMTLPSKLQACMAVGKPILLGMRGDAARIIEASGAGEVVEPENPSAIAQAVLKLAMVSEAEKERMGLQGRAYYRQHMSMQAGVLAFEEIFTRLADSKIHRSLS
jgi:colanic acid biosynthesis glycosyl transferase WcaI